MLKILWKREEIAPEESEAEITKVDLYPGAFGQLYRREEAEKGREARKVESLLKQTPSISAINTY